MMTWLPAPVIRNRRSCAVNGLRMMTASDDGVDGQDQQARGCRSRFPAVPDQLTRRERSRSSRQQAGNGAIEGEDTS